MSKPKVLQDINNLEVFQTAGGTTTTITLTGIELIDGFSKTFIASASNGGGTTTINGKYLYKANTTTAPTLIAGKAYTVWYNLVGNCFFLKANAEGDAIASNVLAGKTFSNDSDTGIVGTLVESSIVNVQSGTTLMTSTTVNVSISSVDMNKSIIIVHIAPRSTSGYVQHYAVGAQLTSTTNLELSSFQVMGSGSETLVTWQVIQFKNVKSLQKGIYTIATTGTGVPVTISTVDISKSMIVCCTKARNTGTSATVYSMLHSAILTDSTTLTLQCNQPNIVTYWQVIEFN